MYEMSHFTKMIYYHKNGIKASLDSRLS